MPVPMSSGNGGEWLPTFGVSPQVAELLMMAAGLPSAGLSFNPPTFVMVRGCELEIAFGPRIEQGIEAGWKSSPASL